MDIQDTTAKTEEQRKMMANERLLASDSFFMVTMQIVPPTIPGGEPRAKVSMVTSYMPKMSVASIQEFLGNAIVAAVREQNNVIVNAMKQVGLMGEAGEEKPEEDL